MKFNQILKTAVKAFTVTRTGGKKSETKLAKTDIGVLTIGLLVAALDGVILPEEYAAFEELAKRCIGGSAKNVRALFDAALPAASRLMMMAQVGIYSESDRLVAFLAAAKKALPRGFAYGPMADVRRAFALWMSVGRSDGEFSSVEKAAVHVLVRRLAIVRAKKTKKPETKAFLQLEADLLGEAEV